MQRTGFGFWNIGQVFCDEAGGGAGVDGAGAGAGGAADENITISKKDFDGRIAAAVAQATKRAAKDALEDPEVKALREFKAEQERKEMERKGEYEKALAAQAEAIKKEYDPKLTAEQERANKLAAKLRDNVVGLRISDAAGKLNAVNPAQVRQLLDGFVRLNDDHEPIVVDESGAQRFVGAKPMTPDQLVTEFLDANPHMVRATSGGGGGAGGGRTLADGAAATEIEAQEARVKAAEKVALETGTPRALALHEAENKKLIALRSKGKAA